MDMNQHRINANLGDAQLEAAPHFFGRKMDWNDVSELLELLNKETRNPNRCISKGQLKTACEGLLIQNKMLIKRLEEVSEQARIALTQHPISFTEDGRLHSMVPASEVLKVFLSCIPILERDAAAQAAAVPEAVNDPVVTVVTPTVSGPGVAND